MSDNRNSDASNHEAHIPVLLQAILDHLVPEDNLPDCLIDGTLGAGGHTQAFLDAGVPTVLGLDRDLQAINIATKRLSSYGDRIQIAHSSYLDMKTEAIKHGWDGVDAILLDLGVSSMQLDTAERGFAFMQDGPLDMRFDPTSEQPPASELVNQWDADDLTEIFYKYGEERHSRRIAQFIVKNRPYETTSQLADIIKQAVPRKRPQKGKKTSRIHPATRVFQALRIAVNDELSTLEKTLPIAIDLLKSGGRLGVISFHSLEDRIVKHYFKDASTEVVSPPGMMLEEKSAIVRLINRKPIIATETEIRDNPRSRSAKLRIVEKL